MSSSPISNLPRSRAFSTTWEYEWYDYELKFPDKVTENPCSQPRAAPLCSYIQATSMTPSLPPMNAAEKSIEFQTALENFIGRIKCDRNTMAAVLVGSFSQEIIWRKESFGIWIIETDGSVLSRKTALTSTPKLSPAQGSS